MHVYASRLPMMDLTPNHCWIGVRFHLKTRDTVPMDVTALKVTLRKDRETEMTAAPFTAQADQIRTLCNRHFTLRLLLHTDIQYAIILSHIAHLWQCNDNTTLLNCNETGFPAVNCTLLIRKKNVPNSNATLFYVAREILKCLIISQSIR